MSKLEELKELRVLREKIDCGECNINDLKKAYDKVNTKQEVIVAQKDNIIHLYYRNAKTRTVTLEKNLIPYESSLFGVNHHSYYPIDLCYLRFYDEDINRFGHGILLPRSKKFVMIDDMDLIKEPNLISFCTRGIKENNKGCCSIVDKVGNLYHIYGYGENDDANFSLKEIKTLNSSLMLQLYGILIYYKNKPVFIDTVEPPYIILDKETLQECAGSQHDLDCYIKDFDDSFMEGKEFVKEKN